MRTLVLWPALVAGCFRTTHRPSCALDPELVGDDVEVAGATGAGLLARVAGGRTVEGAWDDGSDAVVSVDVARTGGAEYVHTTPTTEVTRSFGLGSLHLSIFVPCADFVRVPVALRVSTADEALDVVVDTYVAGPMEGMGAPIDEEWLDVSGDAPLTEATVPAGSEGDPADWDDPYAFARVGFPPGDEPTEGRAGWGGSQETDDTSTAASFTVLEW
jgi:hypothetical protein